MQVFTFHIDGLGGGWLEVNDVVVGQLGIVEDISSHSKHLGNRFYLDQRHDTQLFLDAYRSKYGEPDILHQTEKGESAIRMFPDFELARLGQRARRTLRIDPVTIQRKLTTRQNHNSPSFTSHY